MSVRVLVLVAHSDDESFAMGGRLASLAQDPDVVIRVTTFTNGVSSRLGVPHAAAGRRARHFAAACRALGVRDWIQRHLFPDQEADAVSQLQINRAVNSEVQQFQPTDIYTHFVGDLNIDHRRIAEAVFVACRGTSIRVYSCSPEWPHLALWPFQPTYIYAMAEHDLEAKVRACLSYRDECRPYPHPRSERFVREHPTESFMVIQ